MNPAAMMQVMQRINTFKNQHPMAVKFFGDMKTRGLQEGSVIDIKVTDPDGKESMTNMKITKEDLETFALMSQMKP